MNEFVLVEFFIDAAERVAFLEKLESYGDDFQLIKTDVEYELDNNLCISDFYIRVSGRISSMRASLIKLQDTELADRMKVSYIPSSLKDKYRK